MRNLSIVPVLVPFGSLPLWVPFCLDPPLNQMSICQVQNQDHVFLWPLFLPCSEDRVHCLASSKSARDLSSHDSVVWSSVMLHVRWCDWHLHCKVNCCGCSFFLAWQGDTVRVHVRIFCLVVLSHLGSWQKLVFKSLFLLPFPFTLWWIDGG